MTSPALVAASWLVSVCRTHPIPVTCPIKLLQVQTADPILAQNSSELPLSQSHEGSLLAGKEVQNLILSIFSLPQYKGPVF